MPDQTEQHHQQREMLGFRMARIQARMAAQTANLLRDHGGLSVMQWRVLFFIDMLDGGSPAEITRTFGLDKGQLSRAVREMTKSGLLIAKEGQGGSRGQLLELSAAGKAVFDAARPAVIDRHARLMAVMNAQEREVFLSVLDRLEAEMDQLDAEGS